MMSNQHNIAAESGIGGDFTAHYETHRNDPCECVRRMPGAWPEENHPTNPLKSQNLAIHARERDEHARQKPTANKLDFISDSTSPTYHTAHGHQPSSAVHDYRSLYAESAANSDLSRRDNSSLGHSEPVPRSPFPTGSNYRCPYAVSVVDSDIDRRGNPPLGYNEPVLEGPLARVDNCRPTKEKLI
jgi:hypothetical protein